MMKLICLFAFVVASLAAPQYRDNYSNSVTNRPLAILRLDNDIYPDGSYSYAYETENEISAQEQGQQKPIGNSYGNAAQGAYQYRSPEGIPVQIQYIADENGFQPIGDVLPTPPPTPSYVLRALEYIASVANYKNYRN